MHFIRTGPVHTMVWLHTEVNPPMEEWTFHLDLACVYMKRTQITLDHVRSFVVSDGGAPDVRQRAQLSERLWRGRPSKSAIVTNSLSNPIKRGVATALQWVNPSMAFFAPEQFRQALAHVELERYASEIWHELATMQKLLPRVHSLDLARHAKAA